MLPGGHDAGGDQGIPEVGDLQGRRVVVHGLDLPVVPLHHDLAAVLLQHGLEEPGGVGHVEGGEILALAAQLDQQVGAQVIELLPGLGGIGHVHPGLFEEGLVVVHDLGGDAEGHRADALAHVGAVVQHAGEDVVHIVLRPLDELGHGVVVPAAGVEGTGVHEGHVGLGVGEQGRADLGGGIRGAAGVGELQIHEVVALVKGLGHGHELVAAGAADGVPDLQGLLLPGGGLGGGGLGRLFFRLRFGLGLRLGLSLLSGGGGGVRLVHRVGVLADAPGQEQQRHEEERDDFFHGFHSISFHCVLRISCRSG